MYALAHLLTKTRLQNSIFKLLNLPAMFWRAHKTNSNNGNIIISEEFSYSFIEVGKSGLQNAVTW